jgi:hypothetical protein
MWSQDTAPEEDAWLGWHDYLVACSPVRQPDQAQATQPLANGQDDLSLSVGMLDSVKIVEICRSSFGKSGLASRCSLPDLSRISGCDAFALLELTPP